MTREGGDFGNGRRFELIGEQRRVLTLPTRGAVLIRGGAGSGKTLVAVKRAEYLTKNYSDLFQRARVAVFAYNRDLVAEIQNLVSDPRIRVHSIDSWVYRLLADSGRILKRVSDSDLRECRRIACERTFATVSRRAIAQKSDDFYAAEIRWLKGRRILTLEEYQRTRRTGRGTEDRVTVADRELLWNMFQVYNAQLLARGLRDWEDRVLDALEIVECEDFRAPYTHVVIDEAQDFTFAKIALVRRLVSPETGSITIVADSAQQIYQSGFSWADLGIRVVGRSVEFRRNYRNTRQISEAAYSLMSHERDNADFTQMENSRLEGPRPVVVRGPWAASERYLIETLRTLPKDEDAVIALPTHNMLSQMEQQLRQSGFDVACSSSGPRVPGCVRLSTYHALKGLQFAHVFLWAVADRYFPTVNVEPEETSKSRKLLYVAMTRATRSVVMFTLGNPSSLVAEIDPRLLETKTLGGFFA